MGYFGSPSIPVDKIEANPAPAHAQALPALSVSRETKLTGAATETTWQSFRKQYGEGLEAAFTADHRLARIRAGSEPGIPASRFSSGDKNSARTRADEILHSVGDLIGLNSKFPVQSRSVRSDEISSQIEWVQTYHDVSIEPFGRITMQLDSRGGLRALYSNYISDPAIVNEPTLDDASAKNLALSNLHFTPERPGGPAGRAGKGDLILFAPGPQDSSATVQLKYAYRFWIEGREVIVDAAKGEILSEKDRRQF